MSDPTQIAPRPTDERLQAIAREAARTAASLHQEHAGRLPASAWSEKGTSDFVTEVDREAERIIVGHILAAFPEHRIVAEEGSTNPGDRTAASDVVWIIDPLDGTTNWLHGYPTHAVSIAAADEHGLRVGVVLNSATGEEFVATRGGGAWRVAGPADDMAAIHVSDVAELRLALLGTGFPFKRAAMIPDYLRVLGRMLEKTSGVRRAGAAALDLCDVACGRLDGFWEHWLMPWDVAAGALILTEAGGTLTPLPGGTEPTLADAVAGAGAICDAFAGRTRLGATGPGAFVAGNGRIDEPLRDLLTGILGG
jgi:myo-inositol-1(or 4)-monophosphatase